MEVEQSLKLTETTATLANLKSERTYLSGSDPKMQAVRGSICRRSPSEQQVVTEQHLERKVERAPWAIMASSAPATSVGLAKLLRGTAGGCASVDLSKLPL